MISLCMVARHFCKVLPGKLRLEARPLQYSKDEGPQPLSDTERARRTLFTNPKTYFVSLG